MLCTEQEPGIKMSCIKLGVSSDGLMRRAHLKKKTTQRVREPGGLYYFLMTLCVSTDNVIPLEAPNNRGFHLVVAKGALCMSGIGSLVIQKTPV